MATKICTGCRLPKDAEKDFSWSLLGVKRHSRCKACRSQERIEYYNRNKEKELEYKYDRQKEGMRPENTSGSTYLITLA